MRLAQLARKIAVKPSEIVTFLATHSVTIEDSSNAKITEDHVHLILKHFVPEELIEEAKAAEEGQAPPQHQALEQPEESKVEMPSAVLASTETIEAEGENTPSSEVIKPIKVELPGLKVVGKIDLPEPKKKEEGKGDAVEVENLPPVAVPRRPSNPENRRSVRQSTDQNQRPRKNPIALQREREEKEALRKRQEEERIQKELRTKRYLKKVSTKITPPKPLKRKGHEEEYEVFQEEPAKPKTFLGRILKWFVSE